MFIFGFQHFRLILAIGLLFAAHVVFAQEPLRSKSDSSVRENVVTAIQIANWLQSVGRMENDGMVWPADPKQPEIVVHNLYSGTAGVVLFYLELSNATTGAATKRHLNQARLGGNTLVREVERIDPNSDPGLFTGIAGYGYVLDLLGRETKEKKYQEAAQKCVAHLKRTANKIDGVNQTAVAWNQVTDIIAGSAGIGYFLVHRYDQDERRETLDLAMACGEGLIASAIDVASRGEPKQSKWMMTPTFPREMPNYSHGTAGNSDFLLALHKTCHSVASHDKDFKYDGRFLESAMQGARYLEMLSRKSSHKGLIAHHFPDGDNLFYLGWCHGPTGTARFLKRLASETGDSRWSKMALSWEKQLVAADLSRKRTDGFWNNVGVCCGSAGVASYLIDSQHHMKDESNEEISKQIQLITNDILKRATRVELANGTTGLSWTHAEHRARPELLQKQTGLMQGAAGIGLLFLKLDAIQEKRKMRLDLEPLPVGNPN